MKTNYELITGDFNKKIDRMVKIIKSGGIVIYPTDTIYGLGCDATNEKAVLKVRKIKKRNEKPFSVIAPSKNWIRKNCKVRRGRELNKLPGPYTIIYWLKNTEAVVESVNPKEKSLGVRIPKHWFSKIVSKAGVPVVTTSVNVSGKKHMEKLEDVEKNILSQINLVIYEGKIKRKPSKKIDLR